MSTVDPALREVLRDVLVDETEPGAGFDAELWGRLSDLGFTALTAPERCGGSGAGWLEAAALLTESAAAARHLPLAESDLLAHWLLREAGVPADDPTTPRTLALVGPGGVAPAVPWLHHVPAVVVYPRDNGTFAVTDTPPPDGVPDYAGNRGPDYGSFPGPDYAGIPGLDFGGSPGYCTGMPRRDLVWEQEPEGAVEVAGEVVDRLVLRGALARAVQVVGALDRAVDLCVEHAGARTQFGRPIGKFQAVQQLVADAAAEAALARAAVDAAVLDAVDTDLTGPASASKVAAARSCAGHAASVVVRNAHQVHGAIGTTREHPLRLFTQSALDWRGEFGTTRDWDRFLGETARTGTLWEVVLGDPAQTPPTPGAHR